MQEQSMFQAAPVPRRAAGVRLRATLGQNASSGMGMRADLDIRAIDRVPQCPEPGAHGQPELPTRTPDPNSRPELPTRTPDEEHPRGVQTAMSPSTIAQRTFHLEPVFWTCAAIRE